MDDILGGIRRVEENSHVQASQNSYGYSNHASLSHHQTQHTHIGQHQLQPQHHSHHHCSQQGLMHSGLTLPPLAPLHNEGGGVHQQKRPRTSPPDAGLPEHGLQTLADLASSKKRKPRRRLNGDGNFEAKSNIHARKQGRFANAYGISQDSLTEQAIRPLMRYCQDTAAGYLKVSTNTLSKACQRLNIKWPRRPEVATTEWQKTLNRRRTKRERIPRNAELLLYCEREEQGVQHFHELRLSADGLSVYARWGRVDRPLYRASKKSKFISKVDALNHFHNERAEKLNCADGWVEKPAPEWLTTPKYSCSTKSTSATKRSSYKNNSRVKTNREGKKLCESLRDMLSLILHFVA